MGKNQRVQFLSDMECENPLLWLLHFLQTTGSFECYAHVEDEVIKVDIITANNKQVELSFEDYNKFFEFFIIL